MRWSSEYCEVSSSIYNRARTQASFSVLRWINAISECKLHFLSDVLLVTMPSWNMNNIYNKIDKIFDDKHKNRKAVQYALLGVGSTL